MPLPIATTAFSVDRSDYLRAIWTRKLWKAYAFVTVLWVAQYFTSSAFRGISSATDWAILLSIYLGGYALITLIIYLQARVIVFKRSGAAAYNGRTITFTEMDFTVVTDSGLKQKTPWSAIQFAARRGEFVLLYLTNTHAIILTDGAFESDADRHEVYDLIAKNLSWKGRQPLLGLKEAGALGGRRSS